MVARQGLRHWAYRGFRALPGPVRGVGDSLLRVRAERQVRGEGAFDPRSRRLLIGPLNTAGQAWQWAVAAERHLPDVSARSLWAPGRTAGTLAYPHHWSLTTQAQLRGLAPHRDRVLSATHVVAESARALLGDVHRASVLDDLDALRGAGVRDAVLVHGSEARDLHEHAERYPHSPFRAGWDERFERMQAVVERTRRVLADYDGPVFVPTPDMLDFVPTATLLPITVDVERFALGREVLEQPVPVVLHAPTNQRLKGTARVEEAMSDLERRGLISYRRLEGVPNADMPRFVSEADIVIDQVVLGNAATLVAESLAAGRVVLAHIAPHVRDRTRQHDPQGHGIPVVEADASTVAEVVEQVVADRDRYRDLADQGPRWARQHHDGRAAAAALAPFLGAGGGTSA